MAKRGNTLNTRFPANKKRSGIKHAFRIFFALIVVYMKSVGSVWRALLGLGACYRLAQALSERLSHKPKRSA